MRELTLPGEKGKKVMYPVMKLRGNVDLDGLVQSMTYASAFSPGDIVGIVRSLAQAIACEMAEGHSVKIDGLGTFTPALGLREGAERESGKEGEPRRNATSICLNGIHFKPSRELLHETGKRCHLHRSTDPSRRLVGTAHGGGTAGARHRLPRPEPLHAGEGLYAADGAAEGRRRPRAEAVGSDRGQRHCRHGKRGAQGLRQEERMINGTQITQIAQIKCGKCVCSHIFRT